MCGAHVGKHDAQFRCAPAPAWDQQMNPLIRRKVTVNAKAQPVAMPVKITNIKPVLFQDED